MRQTLLAGSAVTPLQAPRCPYEVGGFLERLLPSPPPKWVEAGPSVGGFLRDPGHSCDTSSLLGVGLSFIGEAAEASFSTEPSVKFRQRPSSPRLGKWARGSKVGAQVRSASELGGPARGNSQRLSRMLGAQVRSASAGSFPSCSQRDLLQCREEPESQEARSLAATASSAFSGGSLPARPPLRPLPPKPRGPPPDFGTELPAQGAALPGAASENVPPQGQRTEMGISKAADVTAPKECIDMDTAAAKLHSDVQRLCLEAMHSLPPGPESTEVSALLRRAGALLCPLASGAAGPRSCC